MVPNTVGGGGVERGEDQSSLTEHDRDDWRTREIDRRRSWDGFLFRINRFSERKFEGQEKSKIELTSIVHSKLYILLRKKEEYGIYRIFSRVITRLRERRHL